MVSNDDDFIGKGTIDNANNVPQWGSNVFLLVDKIKNKVIWRGPNIVLDTFIFESKIAFPVLVEILGGGAFSIQSRKNGYSINV